MYFLNFYAESNQYLTNPNGRIVHLADFNRGKKLVDKIWLIKAEPGKKVNLVFVSFNVMSGSRNCEDNYVEVYNSKDKSPATLIGRYCSQKLPELNRNLPSTSDYLLVIYHGTEQQPETSFELAWETVDNIKGTITLMM